MVTKNICESCGKETQCKDLWGIAHCQKCVRLYNNATNEGVKILMKRHESEFEKIRDKELNKEFA